ncbi:FAD-binding oxidoreductase [Terrabacter sp. MAHUQ-38]|uniref:NAD(P)/FAD-dependent oxidoreductase n=1 Tax=unclassified Terrabacter TaxID=2630222 RepID=UPI00165D9857|nr:FAD-binding oxidoreductase [Terrabacter sp. MAHUQ-38]MBC9824196.1 FAD-binding oxidoreductase [Terrabacter sp. MAHUQ-38]
MKFTSYWLDTAPQGSPARSRTGVEGRTDVAVIGGGLTGVVAALHLARRGAKVHLFEQHTVGFGASGRNGGMATTGMSVGIRQAVETMGFDTAVRRYNAYTEAIDLIEKLVTEEQIDCDFGRPGKLNLASKAAHYQGFEKTAELLNSRLGGETQLVPRAELRREIGSDAFHGGMVEPKSASLHVGKYIRGLGDAAERAGVMIHEQAPVLRLTRRGSGGHDLETPRGRIHADQVLLATGAYTRRPFRWQQVRIAPVGSFIIATEPLDRSVCDDILPNRRVASDSKNLLNYFRITPDNRLLFGGRARFAMSNPQSDEKSGKILRDAMVGFFPQLADARVDYCWGGLVDMSIDRLVHAGMHDGVYYSMGYAGHGVQMATYMGRRMAEYMSGVAEGNVWGDLKFRRIPGHFGPPWFLPVAGAYYKLKDRIS